MKNSKNLDIRVFYNHEFDFDNQHKTTYNDWMLAYENAIRKRAVDGCFIGMSSGYDSGAMACELLRQGVQFKVYSVKHNENNEVLSNRLQYFCDKSVVDEVPKADYDRLYNHLDGKINPIAMQDKASPGVAFMFEAAKSEGRNICLCSQGGDETISDYALFPNQSTFKGVFPDKLFEWDNFRRGMQEEYLNEIEDIASLYGVECRYPYLDVELAQEYLWLSVELKNLYYKAPLREYLIRNRFPFDENVKKGFRPR
jgi:asparagine synthetase B (glutamine-hydrolysing)